MLSATRLVSVRRSSVPAWITVAGHAQVLSDRPIGRYQVVRSRSGQADSSRALVRVGVPVQEGYPNRGKHSLADTVVAALRVSQAIPLLPLRAGKSHNERERVCKLRSACETYTLKVDNSIITPRAVGAPRLACRH